ncbi:MAG: hypothetical protein L7S72_02445 [Flavobacteriales bacterium]|nr:hypothetical protein [Flavobacteriales bacterium]
MEEDAFIFSCDWVNYQNNILIDKENKTVGAWNLDRNKLSYLKYAYAYLTNSDKTVVKKFHIEQFETAKKEKDYHDATKLCFIFSKSEDVFFEWNRDPVQAPRYVKSSEMDNLPRMSDEQKKVNLLKSEKTPKVHYYDEERQREKRERKPRSSNPRKRNKQLTTIEQLVKVKNEKFKDREFKDFKLIPVFEKEVEQGKSAEEVLTNYFNSLDQ